MFFFSGSLLRSRAWLHKEGPENVCLGFTVDRCNGGGEWEIAMGLLIVSRPRTGAQAGVWSHSD